MHLQNMNNDKKVLLESLGLTFDTNHIDFEWTDIDNILLHDLFSWPKECAKYISQMEAAHGLI